MAATLKGLGPKIEPKDVKPILQPQTLIPPPGRVEMPTLAINPVPGQQLETLQEAVVLLAAQVEVQRQQLEHQQQNALKQQSSERRVSRREWVIALATVAASILASIFIAIFLQ